MDEDFEVGVITFCCAGNCPDEGLDGIDIVFMQERLSR